MRDDIADYLQLRFTEELAAAQHATCPQAARAHRELADRFLKKIEPRMAFSKRLSA